MMSLSVIRNAAVLSVKRQTRFAPSLMHYTTENNGKEEVKAEGKEEPKIEVELTEETKKLLAEKDKKIAELKVKEREGMERRCIKKALNRMHIFVV